MNWQLYCISILFITIGIFHFVKPKAFTRVMPLYLPRPILLVYLSGFFEIVVAIALFFEAYRDMALYTIMVMLVLFMPVHIHMITNKKASLNIPVSLLWFRIVLQFLLMYWIYTLI